MLMIMGVENPEKWMSSVRDVNAGTVIPWANHLTRGHKLYQISNWQFVIGGLPLSIARMVLKELRCCSSFSIAMADFQTVFTRQTILQ